MAIPKLRWSGAVCAIALCLAITPLTAEGLILAADRLVHARSLGVARAQDDLERAQLAYEALKAEADRRDGAIETARRARAEADKPVSLTPMPTETCSSRTNRGQFAYECPSVKAAIASNREAMREHAAELKQADAAVRAAESAPAISLERADADLASAKQRLAVEKNDSVMHRTAAAWFGVTPGELSDAQFQAFARVAIGALAISVATATMLAAFVSNLPKWDGKKSRVARAFRAMLAAKRKTLRRLKETIRVEQREHVRFVYVPTDPATGRVLDPDAPHG
jgi:hypothetical protein